MSYTLDTLKARYEDLGPNAVDFHKAGDDLLREILGPGKYRAAAYVTISYTPQGRTAAIFPHIIIDNGGDKGSGRTHLTAAAGMTPHSNPHIWHYEGSDALFIDPMSVSKFSKAELTEQCAYLAAFIASAFGVNVTTFLYKAHTDAKYKDLSSMVTV